MTDGKVVYPEPSKRVLMLLHKKKMIEQIINAIEADSEYIQYNEELRAWFMDSDTRSFEMGKLKFSFVKFHPSKWWKIKPKDFLWKYPQLAEQIGDELFLDQEANGRLTIKQKGEE